MGKITFARNRLAHDVGMEHSNKTSRRPFDTTADLLYVTPAHFKVTRPVALVRQKHKAASPLRVGHHGPTNLALIPLLGTIRTIVEPETLANWKDKSRHGSSSRRQTLRVQPPAWWLRRPPSPRAYAETNACPENGAARCSVAAGAGDGADDSDVAWPPGRAETQMDDERQKAKSSRAKYAGLGAALGAGIGTAVGVATDDLEVWLAVGIAVGIATGVALSRSGGGTHAA